MKTGHCWHGRHGMQQARVENPFLHIKSFLWCGSRNTHVLAKLFFYISAQYGVKQVIIEKMVSLRGHSDTIANYYDNDSISEYWNLYAHAVIDHDCLICSSRNHCKLMCYLSCFVVFFVAIWHHTMRAILAPVCLVANMKWMLVCTITPPTHPPLSPAPSPEATSVPARPAASPPQKVHG